MKEGDFLLSNQEILGGLRAAVERGETLKDAMMTFYQAGYEKSEIESAAKAFLNQTSAPSTMNTSQRLPSPDTPKKKEEKKPLEKLKPAALMLKPIPVPQTPAASANIPVKEKTPQNVSAYAIPKKPANPGKGITVILTVVLLALLGILAAVFLFQEDLVNFFNGLFG
ncbi:MAG: hypothetical protein PF542_01730 [Nanoarchaeota archaeon]|jgi:hypothetical protein|nr:hypothetical protein [Nanoarchaeota archaeon]